MSPEVGATLGIVVSAVRRYWFGPMDGLGRIMSEAWNDDYVDLKHPGIEDFLIYEPTGTMAVMTGDNTVAEATDALTRIATPRVFAVVVTDSGGDRGQPLGIVTPDDLRRPRSYPRPD
jgi:hypothetical protein